MDQNATEVETLREAVRAIARRMSPREIEAASGVGYASVYRFIVEGSTLVPQRATLRKFAAFVARTSPVGPLHSVAGRVVEAAEYQPGPAILALPDRPRAVVLGYLDRFRRAGASEEDLRLAEAHLASERARQFSTDRGTLDEDRLIQIIDITFDAMADVMAERLGRRP